MSGIEQEFSLRRVPMVQFGENTVPVNTAQLEANITGQPPEDEMEVDISDVDPDEEYGNYQKQLNVLPKNASGKMSTKN